MAELPLSGNMAKTLKAIADKMGGGAVQVGFMAGATYPDGTPVASVAADNEYGDSTRPARPFFRQMIAAESPTWPDKMGKLAVATGLDGPRVLAMMGEDIGGGLIQSINNFESPALAPSTIAKKGFAKPLIDKSVMLNSVFYQVSGGEKVKVEP